MPDHAVGQAQQNVEVRPSNGRPTLPLDNWISKDCIDMNKSNKKKCIYSLPFKKTTYYRKHEE